MGNALTWVIVTLLTSSPQNVTMIDHQHKYYSLEQCARAASAWYAQSAQAVYCQQIGHAAYVDTLGRYRQVD